ncbi:MAG: hypothetical protein IKS65_02885, partial [Bacteroidales bacterium]|nr:hypothetical protein [Bacteroidales bacterium]
MRRSIIFIAAVAILLTACASSNNVIKDDAYYSPYEDNSSYDNTLVTSNYGYFDSNEVNNSTNNGTSKIYKEYTAVDSIDRIVDTVYIVDDEPSRHITVTLGAGFGVGYGWGIYYWDPFWYPTWSPYWSFSYYYPYYPYYPHYYPYY